jgi:hypothetical protein
MGGLFKRHYSSVPGVVSQLSDPCLVSQYIYPGLGDTRLEYKDAALLPVRRLQILDLLTIY